MSNEANKQDTIKIKMDTYTQRLYEDFICLLSERLRNETEAIRENLSTINGLLTEFANPENAAFRSIQDTVSNLVASSMADTNQNYTDFKDEVVSKISGCENCIIEQIRKSNANNNSRIVRLEKETASKLQKLVLSERMIREVIEAYISNDTEYKSDDKSRSASMIQSLQNLLKTSTCLLNLIKDITPSIEETFQQHTQSAYNMITFESSKIGDRLTTLEQSVMQEKQSIQEQYTALMTKEGRLADQLNTNQELLVWILTPWYKKIFRRKNEKPSILVK